MADPANTGIYEIVNLVNGKRYIGSAVDWKRRKRIHRYQLAKDRHHNSILQRAWVKYGPEAFEFRLIEWCEPSVLIEREQAAIDRFRPEYNLSPSAGSILGYRYSEDQRAKMRGRKQSHDWVEKRAATHRGSKRSATTRAKIAAKAIGRPFVRHNEDYRVKLSAAAKGRMPSAENMQKLQEARLAYQISEADKLAISEGLKRAYAEGRKSRARPPEYREKIAAGLRGRKATEEHRANQSAAQRGKKRGPYNITAEERLARSERAKRTAEKRNAARWGKPTT